MLHFWKSKNVRFYQFELLKIYYRFRIKDDLNNSQNQNLKRRSAVLEEDISIFVKRQKLKKQENIDEIGNETENEIEMEPGNQEIRTEMSVEQFWNKPLWNHYEQKLKCSTFIETERKIEISNDVEISKQIEIKTEIVKDRV